MAVADAGRWSTAVSYSPTGGLGAAEGAQSPTAGLCWLCSEATWQHGDRPADSWGQEVEPGNSLKMDDQAAAYERSTKDDEWLHPP